MNNNIIELETAQESYEVFDTCYGTVIGSCWQGSFIRLDNDEEAFAYAGLIPGTEVLCTVRRKPRDQRDRTLVSIDSVLTYVPIAA